MSCLHQRFKAQGDVQRVIAKTDEALGADAPAQAFICEISFECAVCGQPFMFQWEELDNVHVIPVSLASMSKRPWTDFARTTLCASIVPMPLEKVHATNEGTLQ